MDKTMFIKTNDPETVQALKSEGFTLIHEDGRKAVFLNDSTLKFSAKKCIFTNILET